jgi:hypothetical protein
MPRPESVPRRAVRKVRWKSGGGQRVATFFSGFVCDEDCENLGESIPRRFGLAILLDIGISEGSADSAVIRHARKHGYIIITKNEVDYEQEMRAAPASCYSQDCRCGGGLITVHGSLRRLPFENMTRDLALGDIKLEWEDVFESNLQVSVRRDCSLEVTRLPMCRWEVERRSACASCARLDAVMPPLPVSAFTVT